MDINTKRVIELATALVLSRGGDISNEDGNFATVDDNIIIELESAIALAFELESDDVNSNDVPMIIAMLEDLTK